MKEIISCRSYSCHSYNHLSSAHSQMVRSRRHAPSYGMTSPLYFAQPSRFQSLGFEWVPFTLAWQFGKPESFSHSGFSLKVARQLPLNTPKNPNRKTHLRIAWCFWNSAEISLVFCQCKRSFQSRRYYSGFWSRGTWPSAESPDRWCPRRNAHYTCTVKGREKSRMRTTYQNTRQRFRFFSLHALFVPKTPNVMGFSGSVNGTTKNPGFLDFVFCQCK